MKKKILLAMCAALMMSSSAYADTGIWITKHYIDEFKQPTEDAYITTDVINGTFSNSATTDALLQVIPLIDDEHVTFQLWEYGQIKVVGYLSSGQDFDITVLAPDGSKTAMKGYLNDGVDRVVLYDSYVPYFFDILNQNGPVSILMKSGRSSYLFTLEDTTGIKEEYLNSFEEMPHHNTGTAEELEVTLEHTASCNRTKLWSEYEMDLHVDIETNLPDGTTLIVRPNLSGENFILQVATVQDGHCSIDTSLITEHFSYNYIGIKFTYGKQPDSIYEEYGDSLEKFTGEISDKMKTDFGYMSNANLIE